MANVEEVTDKLGMADVLDVLNDDSDSKTDDKATDTSKESETAEEIKLTDEDDDSEEEEETKESEDEEKDEELEIKDDESDELEFQNVPARKAILAKYPDLFKTFPGIERAIFREDEYTKIFPSIQEAKEAQSQLENFRVIQQDLFSGNLENLLTELKGADTKAFSKITNNLLDTVNKIDPTASLKIVNKITKAVLANVASAGKKMKDKGNDRGEQYELAAQYLHEALYGDPTITPLADEAEEDKPNPKEAELSKREQEFNQRELNNAVNEVSGKINKSLESAVQKYIDPKGVMSEYVKDKAVRDVLASFEREFKTDARFKIHLDKLWLEAKKNNYSEESKVRIRKAVISKAESSLRDHIKSVRSKVLKSSTNRAVVRKEEARSETKKLTPSRSTTSSTTNKEKPRRVGGVADVMKFLE